MSSAQASRSAASSASTRRGDISETAGDSLLPTFLDLYEKFEKVYLEFREEANSLLSDDGARPPNHDRLVDKLRATDLENRFQKWRKTAWQPLGAMARKMSKEERNLHIKFVSKSQARTYCQESRFCWRIIQRPDGYVGDAEMMKLLYRDE